MTARTISRRNFLQTAGIALAAGTLTCAGLSYVAVLPPEIAMPEITSGKDITMNERILITYATRAGSTVEVAAAIAESLAARGFAVDVKPVKEKPGLSGYQSVILGSAIRMGGWLPEMLDYIQANQAALKSMPAALFTVHMLNTGEDETSRAARIAYTQPARSLLPAAPEVFFSGKIDYATLSFFDRLMAKAVEKNTGTKPGDYRDWQQIRSWGMQVFA